MASLTTPRKCRDPWVTSHSTEDYRLNYHLSTDQMETQLEAFTPGWRAGAPETYPPCSARSKCTAVLMRGLMKELGE